ncbi:MAG: glucosamine-6-phosphate deaminase [Actinomycetaceae bacterium]|nr:glucosamine-6-phosphate deaminase [Actinomycetaceae bacterium]
MRIAILPDNEAIGKVGADLIEELFNRKPEAILGLATGSSPLPIYQEVIRRHRGGKVSFAKGRAFTLDEYVGLPVEHPQRYRNFIRQEFTDQVDFRDEEVNSPEGNAEDLAQACADYDQAIKDAGGVDLQILGIGSDGHIAFNEPGGSLASRTHVGVLTEQTRTDNARFFDDDLNQVPTHCVTQGLGTIMEARRLVLVAQGDNKAEAVRQMVEGAISAHWPATIMQMHPDAWILLDEQAASKLKLSDYYREVWEKSNL